MWGVQRLLIEEESEGDVVVGTAAGDVVVGTVAGDIVVVWCSECEEGMGSEIQPRGNAVVVVAA